MTEPATSQIDARVNAEPQIPGCLPMGYSLDSLLNAEQCRIWLQLKPLEFAEKTRKKQIPFMDYGQRSKRFHPRTIIAAKSTK